jgi:hypothetical protein
MLDHWGYRYLAIGNALTHLEMGLGVHLGLLDDAKEMRLSDLQEDATARDEFLAKCHEIDALIGDQDLGAINGNLAALTAKIFVAGKRKTPLYAMDLLKDVQRLKNDFALILSKRLFYSLPSELSGLYGKPTLFGEAVAKKFPKASNDIEWAGNCLAGQPTACVLHLDRAMEIALHKLAKKLGFVPNAKANMGSILADMVAPIKAMPDTKASDKRKKELWSECRTNLYHVKMAWRDPSSHGKQTYSESQARDIFDRVKGFLQQLTTLL